MGPSFVTPQISPLILFNNTFYAAFRGLLRA